MNIEEIECLLELSKTLSYSSAARNLFITQSALSQRITRMEKELGFPLVIHGITPIQLTSYGELFVAEGQRIVDKYQKAVTLCRTNFAKKEHTVRIPNIVLDAHSVQDIAALARSIDIVPELIDKSKFIQLSEFEALNDVLDISFTFAPSSDLSWFGEELFLEYSFVHLNPEPLAIIVSKDSPLAKQEKVDVNALSAYELVFVNTPFYYRCEQAIQTAIENRGIKVDGIFGTDRAQFNIVSLSINHVAVMFAHALFLSKESFGGNVVACELDDPGLNLVPYVIYRKDNLNPDITALIEIINSQTKR